MSQVVESLKNKVVILKSYSIEEHDKYNKSLLGLEDFFEYAKSKGQEIPKELLAEIEELINLGAK